MLIGNDDKVLVSVIIPAFNSARFVSNAINSILIQTYECIELLLLNDGSNDDTLNIFKSFNDKRIRIINSNVNTKKVGLVNDVLKQVKGKYIMFQDSDDTCSENRVEIMVNYLESNKNIGICFSGYTINDIKLKNKWRLHHSDLLKEFLSTDINDRFYSNTVYATAMFSSDLLIQVPGYSKRMQGKIGEDIEFFYSLCQFTEACTLPFALYNYNLNRIGSLTHFNGLNRNVPNYDLNFVKASIQIHKKTGKSPIRDFNDKEYLKFEYDFMRDYIEQIKREMIVLELTYQSSSYYKLGRFILYPISYFFKWYRNIYVR